MVDGISCVRPVSRTWKTVKRDGSSRGQAARKRYFLNLKKPNQLQEAKPTGDSLVSTFITARPALTETPPPAKGHKAQTRSLVVFHGFLTVA